MSMCGYISESCCKASFVFYMWIIAEYIVVSFLNVAYAHMVRLFRTIWDYLCFSGVNGAWYCPVHATFYINRPGLRFREVFIFVASRRLPTPGVGSAFLTTNVPFSRRYSTVLSIPSLECHRNWLSLYRFVSCHMRRDVKFSIFEFGGRSLLLAPPVARFVIFIKSGIYFIVSLLWERFANKNMF